MTLCHMCTVCPHVLGYISDLIWLGGHGGCKVYMFREEMYVQLVVRWPVVARGQSSAI